MIHFTSILIRINPWGKLTLATFYIYKHTNYISQQLIQVLKCSRSQQMLSVKWGPLFEMTRIKWTVFVKWCALFEMQRRKWTVLVAWYYKNKVNSARKKLKSAKLKAIVLTEPRLQYAESNIWYYQWTWYKNASRDSCHIPITSWCLKNIFHTHNGSF